MKDVSKTEQQAGLSSAEATCSDSQSGTFPFCVANTMGKDREGPQGEASSGPWGRELPVVTLWSRAIQ